MDHKEQNKELAIHNHNIKIKEPQEGEPNKPSIPESRVVGQEIMRHDPSTDTLQVPIRSGTRSKRSSTSQSFDGKFSNNFDELEFAKDDESDQYDSNGKKKTFIRRTSFVETSNNVLINLNDKRDFSAPREGNMGGFEDIVHTVKIHEDEVHEIQGNFFVFMKILIFYFIWK